eukprot:TRINITY_DN55913_c0_g1_i1.p1 TRINITY_DN55913_c0_g1~~TRINITY_DN55913_c0_g1_i1.p1  ORF type:complete len:241 (-),score=28.61 TRINITY_DN55913_c0_g1_i1:81-803(-)
MSFGMYRPTMGVAGGHRETSSHNSVQDIRRQSERYQRQENPITGEQMSGSAPSSSRRPPSGNLTSSLVPSKGPMDHMTVPNRDVPARRTDPTRNQSTNFDGGIACVPTAPQERARSLSRLTDSALGEGFTQREPTPERRRRTPGEVVRGGCRPKDNLTSGLLTADKQDHPLALPRKAGSCGAGVGSGGAGHLVQGPLGFVPGGAEDMYGESELRAPSPGPNRSGPSFRRACGVVATGRAE